VGSGAQEREIVERTAVEVVKDLVHQVTRLTVVVTLDKKQLQCCLKGVRESVMVHKLLLKMVFC
jgi:hypothetical protein